MQLHGAELIAGTFKTIIRLSAYPESILPVCHAEFTP